MASSDITTQHPLKGGCYCGAVRYTINDDLPTSFTFCHCRTCQQLSGSAFLPFVPFKASKVEFATEPASALKTFEASKYAKRQFCGICGSTLNMRYNASGDRISIAVASFDEESAKLLLKPTEHIYLMDKADWFPLNENDGLKRHETMERATVYFGGKSTQSE